MSDIHIASGYQVGLIGRVTEMHMAYYAKSSGFGHRFESVVAAGLAGSDHSALGDRLGRRIRVRICPH